MVFLVKQYLETQQFYEVNWVFEVFSVFLEFKVNLNSFIIVAKFISHHQLIASILFHQHQIMMPQIVKLLLFEEVIIIFAAQDQIKHLSIILITSLMLWISLIFLEFFINQYQLIYLANQYLVMIHGQILIMSIIQFI